MKSHAIGSGQRDPLVSQVEPPQITNLMFNRDGKSDEGNEDRISGFDAAFIQPEFDHRFDQSGDDRAMAADDAAYASRHSNKSVRQLLDDIRKKNYQSQKVGEKPSEGVMAAIGSGSTGKRLGALRKGAGTSRPSRQVQANDKFFEQSKGNIAGADGASGTHSPKKKKKEKRAAKTTVRDQKDSSEDDGITPKYLRDMRDMVDADQPRTGTSMNDDSARYKSASQRLTTASRLADRTERLKALTTRFKEESEQDQLQGIRKENDQKSFNTTFDQQQDIRPTYSSVLQNAISRPPTHMRDSYISQASVNSNSQATVNSAFVNFSESAQRTGGIDPNTLRQLKMKAKNQTALLCLNNNEESNDNSSFREAIMMTQDRINQAKESLQELSMMMDQIGASQQSNLNLQETTTDVEKSPKIRKRARDKQKQGTNNNSAGKTKNSSKKKDKAQGLQAARSGTLQQKKDSSAKPSIDGPGPSPLQTPTRKPGQTKAVFDRLSKEKLGRVKYQKGKAEEWAGNHDEAQVQVLNSEIAGPIAENKVKKHQSLMKSTPKSLPQSADKKTKSFVEVNKNRIQPAVQEIPLNIEKSEKVWKSLQRKYGIESELEVEETNSQKQRPSSSLRASDRDVFKELKRAQTSLKFIRHPPPERLEQPPFEIARQESEITSIKPVSRLSNVPPPEIKIDQRHNPFTKRRRSKSIEKLVLKASRKSREQQQTVETGVIGGDRKQIGAGHEQENGMNPDDSIISSIKQNTVHVIDTVHNTGAQEQQTDCLQLSSEMSEVDLDRRSRDKFKEAMSNIKNIQIKKAAYLGQEQQSSPGIFKKSLKIIEPQAQPKINHSKITRKSYREQFLELILFSHKRSNQTFDFRAKKQSSGDQHQFLHKSSYRILKLILGYLESYHGPARDEFKLYVVSKAFQNQLIEFNERYNKGFLACLNESIKAFQVSQPKKIMIKQDEQKLFKRRVYICWLRQSYYKSRMLETFMTQPDLSKYRGNLQHRLKIQKSYNDELFGGHVTIGLNNHQIFQSEPHSIKKLTRLQKQIQSSGIVEFQKILIKGKDEWDGRAFYYLQNVRISAIVYWDIFILVDRAVQDAELVRKLELWHERSLQMLAKEKESTKVSILKPYINRNVTQEEQPAISEQFAPAVATTPQQKNQGQRLVFSQKKSQQKQSRQASVSKGDSEALWHETLRFDNQGQRLAAGSRVMAAKGSNTKRDGNGARKQSEQAAGNMANKQQGWNSSSNLNSKRQMSPGQIDGSQPMPGQARATSRLKIAPAEEYNDSNTNFEKKKKLPVAMSKSAGNSPVNFDTPRKSLNQADLQKNSDSIYSRRTFIDFCEIKEALCGFARIFEFQHSMGEVQPQQQNRVLQGPVIASRWDDGEQGAASEWRERAEKVEGGAGGLQQQPQVIFHQKSNKLQYLNEGQIWKGHFEGFVRSLDFRGNCQVGFWSVRMCLGDRSPYDIKVQSQMPRTLISRPYGKWAHYNSEGEMVCPEGIYRGDQKQWNKIVREMKIDSFQTNIQPQLSLGQRFSDMFQTCCSCQSQQQAESLIQNQARQCNSASGSLGMGGQTARPMDRNKKKN